MSEKSALLKKTEVSFDAKSFSINGERIFVNSAAIHYFRMPRQEWREVLVKAKLAGMNCIDTYFAWNVHEPEEGQWTFEEDNDCGAFLDLCAELGLWVIARPGPFICAEWDFGGFPWWLSNKEGLQYREYNPTFLHYVDQYFDRIIPIIQSRLATAGGTVILVQVENEYGYLKDDVAAQDYMFYLRDGLTRRGIDVPLITCDGGAEGTIEGANFWSGADGQYQKLVDKQPLAPKIVTEFWTGWFEHWGAHAATQKTAHLYEKRMMEAIRAGFDGISHYMFFGGTNFGGYGGRTVGSSDVFMVTSYDYDAPLNEYGRITDKYAAAKRVSLFTLALQHFLLESEEIEKHHASCSKGFSVRSRSWGSQKLWFVESHKDERDVCQLTIEPGRTIPVSVKPGQLVPVLDRMEVGQGLTLTSNTFIACNEVIEGERTIMVWAEDRQRSVVEFESDAVLCYRSDSYFLAEQNESGTRVRFDFCHFEEPQMVQIQAGDNRVKVIVLNRDAMDRTWRVGSDNKTKWITGFDDIDFDLETGRMKGVMTAGRSGLKNRLELPPPALSEWTSSAVVLQTAEETVEAAPRSFSQFGQAFGYLLYECECEEVEARDSLLIIPKIQDSARVFLNGKEQAFIREVGASSVFLPFSKGRNKLQLMVQHMGRLNFSPFLGEAKGIDGSVYLDGQRQDLRRGWKVNNDQTIHLDEAAVLEDNLWLTRTFTVNNCDGAAVVGALSSEMRINGTEVPLEGYRDWFSFHTQDISEYIQPGENTIEMKFTKAPLNRFEILTYSRANELQGWRMAGMDALSPAGEWTKSAEPNGGPVWHRNVFKKPLAPEHANIRLKLRLTGMSKGMILLNGKDLGRFWQIGPQEDYKIPMAWLEEENELLLFDEEGRSPARIKLQYDSFSDLIWHDLD